jgi:hypothetical protein
MILDTIALLLAAFLFGYFLGKHLGHETGVEEGKAIAPVLLRQQSYELGYCLLCLAEKNTAPKDTHSSP